MKAATRYFLIAGLLLLVQSTQCFSATVRGRLVCNGGNLPATGVAVTVFSQQFGRSSAFFTGGDGMYYFTVPAGQYVLEVWLSKQSPAPTNTYPVFINDPMTDFPPVYLPVCFAQ